MAGSRVPRDDISPEMRKFLDELARRTFSVSNFTSTEAGLVPLSGGGIINFLRADGSWVAPVGLFKVLTADEAVTDGTSAQPWFPTAGGVTVAATTSYFMQGRLLLIDLGANARTIALSFGGTATLTSIDYYALQDDGAALDAVGALNDTTFVTAASATVVSGSDTTATINITIDGVIRINGAGTLIPQFTWSAAPGGTPLVKRNSYIRLTPIGSNTVASQGTWA
jgi:hypothetical protein